MRINNLIKYPTESSEVQKLTANGRIIQETANELFISFHTAIFLRNKLM